MIREARRTQNSKQDKIQVVKSQPSVNSLREGQEVIYISKSNRLERYRKEQGRLWVSFMDTDNSYTVNKNLNVGSDLTVGNNLRIEGVLDVNGSIDLDGDFDINGTLSATQIVEHTGNTGTNIQFGTNTINFRSAHSNANGNVSLGVNSEGVIINNQGEAGIDFRVESDTIQNALKVDSGTNTLSSECVIIKFTALPTSDPSNAGQLWNDSGTLKISAG
jgi:cytoskeletal protein CcmA (bactofilin family)|tara:strand:+ start:2250 stop:2906 length:657 start_codon:yes stop_codon:yes gene_type:complete